MTRCLGDVPYEDIAFNLEEGGGVESKSLQVTAVRSVGYSGRAADINFLTDQGTKVVLKVNTDGYGTTAVHAESGPGHFAGPARAWDLVLPPGTPLNVLFAIVEKA